jgi:glycosyltransferase involved in cell wall biosynthesis
MIKRPKISVVVITYNQQETIGQTLESILMQKGDFDLELMIGEDCSPDNTLAICQDYAKRYPQIKLLSGSKNLGITANYFRTLQACTGELIGDIAGDDYYCDDHALEKQMLYLQSHPEVGVLGANGYRYYVKRNEKVLGENKLVNIMDAKEFYFSPKYPGGVIIQGGGVMFRRSLLQYIDYDEIIRRKLPVEDYPMQAIWSQYTKFWRLDDPIVVYRVYKESATFIPLDHPRYLSYHKGLAATRRYLNELFPKDACISEEWLQEYEFYKEFLLYLHQLDYKKAKALIEEKTAKISNSAKLRQAKRFTKTWLHFVAAHYYKEYTYKKDIKDLQ